MDDEKFQMNMVIAGVILLIIILIDRYNYFSISLPEYMNSTIFLLLPLFFLLPGISAVKLKRILIPRRFQNNYLLVTGEKAVNFGKVLIVLAILAWAAIITLGYFAISVWNVY